MGYFDFQVVHALSVSLNKLGDLKYYAEDLEAARAFYARALSFRLDGISDFTTLSSQVFPVPLLLLLCLLFLSISICKGWNRAHLFHLFES